MKSYTIALIATSALAQYETVTTDFAVPEYERSKWDQMKENVEEELNDAGRDFEREVERAMEDLACWWADRTPTGTCPKYEREAMMDACWNEDKEWMWEERVCISREEAQKIWTEQSRIECAEENFKWIVDEWGNEWCEWGTPANLVKAAPHLGMQKVNLKRSEAFDRYFAARYANAPAPVQAWKASFDQWTSTQMRPKALIEVEADLNLTELEQAAKPVQSGVEDLGMLLGEYAAQLEALSQQWQPKIDEWVNEQERREVEAAQSIATQLVDNIYVDGTPLRDLVGGPENWMMARRVPGTHKNVFSLFALDHVVMQESTVAHVHISLPTEEEINAFLMETAEKAEETGKKIEEFAEKYGRMLDDMRREAEDEAEDIVDEAFDNVVNPIGDAVKTIVTNSTSIEVNGMDIPIELASKAPAAQESSYGTAFAGATFGVIATLAACAMASTCSKKRIANNQESLL